MKKELHQPEKFCFEYMYEIKTNLLSIGMKQDLSKTRKNYILELIHYINVSDWNKVCENTVRLKR